MRIGVVLINWNSGEYTLPCIATLQAATRVPDRILVVDNASTDKSPDILAAVHPEVTLLRLGENTGFAGGNNLGMQALLEAGMDAVWILNNDTEVRPDCLAVMERALEADVEIGGVTGKMLYADRPDRVWYAGGRITASLDSDHLGQGNPDRPGEAMDTEFVTGCSMLIRREALERVGGFDNCFFAYCEDVDWCLRARAVGLRLRYLPDAVLLHHVSSSTTKNTLGDAGGRVSPTAHYLMARNRTFLHRRHGGRRWTTRLHFLWLQAALLLRGRLTKWKALRRGLRDGKRLPLPEPGGFDGTSEYGVPPLR